MKKLISVISLVTILFSGGTGFAVDFGGATGFAVDFEVETGFNYDWWESDEDDQGQQFFIPLQIAGQYKQFSFRVLTAYAYTDVDLSEAYTAGTPFQSLSPSLSNFVDTKVNLSYEILEGFPVDILFGLDFNLPSGKTDLEEKDLYLIMDPDLISITSLGEGFNINPVMTLAQEWGKWVAGIGLGYVWRGEYDYSSNYQNYDPGDIFNLNAELAYDFSPNWRGRLFGEYADFGKDEMDNADFYQEGDFLSVGIGLNHYQTTWDAGLTIRGIFRDKGEMYQLTSGISDDCHGDEWIADFSYRYFLDDETTLKSLLEFLWIDENAYPSNLSPFYFGEKKKVSLELGVVKPLSPYINGELYIKGFYLDEDKNLYHPNDDIGYTGFSIGANLTSRF